MGRFERQDSEEGIPAALGTATQKLRTTVEEKLREIIEAAEARAHEIEDRALAQALEIEQDSEEKGRRRFQSSAERADQMVAAVDAFEQEITEALGRLREKGRALAAELGAETPAAAPAAAEDPAAAEEAPTAEEAAEEDPREGVRKRILDLFLAGAPRMEAERMLGGIEDGGRYVDLLDEVYEGRAETQQGSRRRRGGRRRRRPGSPE